MAQRDPLLPILDMIEHAREAIALVHGKTRDTVEKDRILTLALTRLLEVVGEAAARVPPEIRAAHPAVPWSAIVGMRNRLIHAYDDVDFGIFWRILSVDLPDLVPALERIAQEHQKA